jgi:alpha-1,6-mannosyltransferase
VNHRPALVPAPLDDMKPGQHLNPPGKSSVLGVVRVLGCIILASTLVHSFLSYYLAYSQISLSGTHNQELFLARLFAVMPWKLPIPDLVFQNASAFYAGYCLPLSVTTVSALALIGILYRIRSHIDASLPRYLLLWSIGFGLAAFPAFNVLTQDFWLSVVWGRMINSGINPYVVPFPLELATDIPLDHLRIRMTYGPLWAVISAAVVAVCSDRPILMWIVFKSILIASWFGCLGLVSALTRDRVPYQRCWAIAVVGWLPLCLNSVSEGHNDIVMAVLALMWIYYMPRGRPYRSALALAGSILIKYTTAPLAAVDFLFFIRGTRSWRNYILGIIPFGILIAFAAVWWFAAGNQASDTTEMESWKFLAPADMLRAAETIMNLRLPGHGHVEVVLVLTACLAVLTNSVLRFWKVPDEANLHCVCLSTMCLVTWVLVGHVWPWFLTWCIVFAALVPDFWLSKFAIGTTLAAPFTIVHWWRVPDMSDFYRNQLPALAIYGVALAFTVATSIRDAPPEAVSADGAVG